MLDAGTPVKASLSSRLGVIVDANANHNVPDTPNSTPQKRTDDRLVDTSGHSRSPDRKRSHEGKFDGILIKIRDLIKMWFPRERK